MRYLVQRTDRPYCRLCASCWGVAMCWSRGPSIMYANRVHLSTQLVVSFRCSAGSRRSNVWFAKSISWDPGDVPGTAADTSARAESELVLAPRPLCAFPHPLSIDTLSTKGVSRKGLRGRKPLSVRLAADPRTSDRIPGRMHPAHGSDVPGSGGFSTTPTASCSRQLTSGHLAS
jgi:hypothetical protein